jgi:hypothetical protein
MNDTTAFANFPPIGFVIATKRVVEEENKACFMYRHEPIDAQDSGWRIFAGDESEEYMNNPENSDIYPPVTLLTLDDSIRELLLMPVGSAFMREDPTSEWRETKDFSFTEAGGPEGQALGGGWTVKISSWFEKFEEEDGDFVFVMPGRTARVAIWEFPDKTHEQVVQMHRDFIDHRDATEFPTLESFDLSEVGITRIGFVVEESDDEHSYKVLHGYTAIGSQVAQAVLYYDEDADREWALQTWMSIGNA